jgi:hypothetical protein
VYIEILARFADPLTNAAVPVVPWVDTLMPLFDAEEEATPKVHLQLQLL